MPISGVNPASRAAESEAGLVSGVAPASQPATEVAPPPPTPAEPAGSEEKPEPQLPDGATDVKNPWADISETVDYGSDFAKASSSVWKSRPTDAAISKMQVRPTPRDKQITQWVRKSHSTYVKNEPGSSSSGVTPATEDLWARYVPTDYSKPPAGSVFIVKREVKTEAGGVSGVTPASTSLATRVKTEQPPPPEEE